MFWSDIDIINGLKTGLIEIDPFDENLLQPASYDITLGNKLIIYNARGGPCNYWDLCELGYFEIRPGDFILGSTEQRVKLDNGVVARIEGKSTNARNGLLIHTAGYVDPGFAGQLTLEISCLHPHGVQLHAGMRIGQLSFNSLLTKTSAGYGDKKWNSHYQGQVGPTPASMDS